MNDLRFKHVVEIGSGDSASTRGGVLYQRAEKVSLYEPNVLLRTELVYAARSVSNVEIFPYAISDRNELKNFYHFGYASYLEGAKSFLALAEDEIIDPIFWRPLARPVAVMSMVEIDNGDIDFLILTPNGMELEILSVMKSRPDIIHFNTYLHNGVQVAYAQQIFRLLQKIGYTKIASIETNEHSTFHRFEARIK